MSKKRKNEMSVQVTRTVTCFIDVNSKKRYECNSGPNCLQVCDYNDEHDAIMSLLQLHANDPEIVAALEAHLQNLHDFYVPIILEDAASNPYATWSIEDLKIASDEAVLRRDNAKTDLEFVQEDFTYYLIDTVLKEKLSNDELEDEDLDASANAEQQALRLKKAKFKIQIADMFLPMQDFTLAQSNKHYPEHTVVDATQSSLRYKTPASPIYVDIPKGYNIYTYDSKEYGITEYQAGAVMEFTSFYNITLRLMNLVATGHLITLVTPDGTEYTMGTPSLKFTDVQILNQIEYLTKKYSKITDAFYQQYLIDTFGSVGAARGYFATEDWMEENRILDRYTTLNNLFRDTLMDIQHDRESAKELLRNKQREAEILDLSADLEAALPTITRYDLIPNQDVTAPLSHVINYQVRFEAEQLGSRKEYGSAYFTPGVGLTITESDLMEQAAINAYYYASPEFRVPTELELEAEYEQLAKEYEDLRKLAAQNPVKATLKAKRWNKEGKYERYLELHDHFNTVLHGMLQE